MLKVINISGFLRKVLTVLILVITQSVSVNCSISSSDSLKGYYAIKSIIQIMTGFSFVTQSQAFTEDYINYLGGSNTDYKMSPSFTLYYKLDFFKHFRPCILFDYSTSKFTDNYSQNYEYFGKTNYRQIGEQIDVSTSTTLFCIEYLSVPSPYRTLAGLGAGISYSNISWIETVVSTGIFDKRKSGQPFDGDNYSFAVRLYAGIDLDFDKENERQFLGGLHFEGAFLWLYRTVPILKNLRNQVTGSPEYWSDNISFLPFYINLNVGISFNLFHELKGSNEIFRNN